eukprot:7329361-Pyramimonas_sp.AAC.2
MVKVVVHTLVRYAAFHKTIVFLPQTLLLLRSSSHSVTHAGHIAAVHPDISTRTIPPHVISMGTDISIGSSAATATAP